MAKTGKIFKDSSNIYQDEAKILFSYYKRCAERIVAEEERIEGEIQTLESDKASVEESMTGWWNKFLNFILFRNGRLKRQLASIEDKIDELHGQHKAIFRDYKVEKLGVVYVPVAEQVKYGDKSFIVDLTGEVGNSEITLQMPRKGKELSESIQQLAQLTKEVPVVDTDKAPEEVNTSEYSTSIQKIHQGDYIGKMDRSMKSISYYMSDLETSSVELPLVRDKSEELAYLQEYSTTELPEGSLTVDVFDKQRYAGSVDKFQDLNKLQDSLSTDTEELEGVLRSLIMTMSGIVQSVSRNKLISTDKLIDRSNFLLYQILKAPYNHYSPVLESEEINRIKNEKFDYSDNMQGYEPFTLKSSSRVRYDLFAGNWKAEDGSTVTTPFGVHQIYEEIVAPLVQNLMEENRIERLRIYNHIHDQKLSYVTKWHQDVDAFYRSNHQESADIINNMQKTLSEYTAAYNTLVQLEKTLKSMEEKQDLDAGVVKAEDKSQEVLAAFELEGQKYKKVQDDFMDFMDRLQDDIAAKAEQFGHVEYYDARLRDGYSNEAAVASAEVADMDERRKQLAESNPLLAKEAVLPPRPNVEDLTREKLSLNLPQMAKNALDEINPPAERATDSGSGMEAENEDTKEE